jgi:hypothetical protein
MNIIDTQFGIENERCQSGRLYELLLNGLFPGEPFQSIGRLMVMAKVVVWASMADGSDPLGLFDCEALQTDP